jgi:hypothetical protein
MPPRTFKSGEIAPVSGIYLTFHSSPQSECDEVFVEQSKPFPCCLKCLRQITFKLQQAVKERPKEK